MPAPGSAVIVQRHETVGKLSSTTECTVPTPSSERHANWVLVADAGRARVFASGEHPLQLLAVPGATFEHPVPASRELGNERPGRVIESHGRARHAVEPKTDPHRAEKQAFAETLVAWLEERRRQKAFEGLVLVAPPVMLGDLRKLLTGELGACVVAEVDKDLTRLSDRDVAEHLRETLAGIPRLGRR
jgi:protein required for attachment to host cells